MTEERQEDQTPEIALSEIDLEALAEILVELLRRELLLENERLGKL